MASRAPTSRPESLQQPAFSAPQSTLTGPPQPGRSSPSHSTYSEDSQTVILNAPAPDETPSEAQDQPKRALKRSQTASSAGEPRKCWICFSDETEDSQIASEWRSPCPCALTAHEACLLDWIADKENPQHNGAGRPQKIECPQCKAEIRIARPRSRIVEWYQSLEDAAGRLFWPGIITSLASGLSAACVLHGASTVYMLLGHRDAAVLLGVRHGRIPSSNTILGLASIPVVLMISSTTLADSLLPVLPFIYVAIHRPTRSTGFLWPPSAAMTLATLPYMRAMYNGLRKKLFHDLEREWARQIQPRGGEDGGNADTDGDQDQAPADEGQGGIMNFELGVELEIIEEEEAPAVAEQQQDLVHQAPHGVAGIGDLGQGQAPDADQEHNRDDALDQDLLQHENDNQDPVGAPNQDAQAARNQNPGLPAEHHRVVRLVPLVSAVVHTMMGALAFPAVAAGMGDLILLFLPYSWKVPPRWRERRSPGLLQSRFGRSVVGGCLFLFLKDTVSLYSKYRLAQDHIRRRVLDCEGKDKKARAR
ncbi:MAG: hypothetical protein LQ348_000690 [Seirophora lacunosa]|nr:MAG: hypothetical protein LQ348_000690 [Seirophora lacunosa]